jgi:hypothetical protein
MTCSLMFNVESKGPLPPPDRLPVLLLTAEAPDLHKRPEALFGVLALGVTALLPVALVMERGV